MHFRLSKSLAVCRERFLVHSGDDPDLLLGQGRAEGTDIEEISLYLYPRAQD